VVRPTTAAILTNAAYCVSPILDPRKVNNSGIVKTEVNSLQIGYVKAGNNLYLGWTDAAEGFTLQGTTNLAQPFWEAVTNTVISTNGQKIVVLPIGSGSQFFRLISQ
jgi:hypothetical protein